MEKQPDRLTEILKVASQPEAAEIKVLHNAQLKTLRSYQDDPTAIRKKDWDAAKGGYEECETRLWYKYFEKEAEEEAGGFEYDPGDPLIVTTTQAAYLFGVSLKCFGHDWVKAGMPRISQGKFNLKACFDWWWDSIASEKAAKMGGDESINEAKRQYWWSKAEEGQIKVKVTKEDLIPRDDVYRQWAMRMAEYKNGCYGIINALPPLLEGQDQATMRTKIEDYVWNMFKRVVRYGKFCKQQPQSGKAGKKKK